MRDPLVTLLGGKTKARILDVLLSNPAESFHLRGLAQAAGTDSGNTSKLLTLLVEIGLVTTAADRHSTRYAIDARSPLALPLRQLIASAGALVRDLRAVAAQIDAPYTCVFGSYAAGTGDANSDIDVLVVGELSAVAAQAAFKAVGRKHCKAINVVAVPAPEFRRRIAEREAFWASVAQGRRIDLKGEWVDVADGHTVAGGGARIRALSARPRGRSRVDRIGPRQGM